MKTTEKFVSDDELKMLRESFIINYSKDKGWDPNNLTEDQLMEIKKHRNYINPGMLLS